MPQRDCIGLCDYHYSVRDGLVPIAKVVVPNPTAAQRGNRRRVPSRREMSPTEVRVRASIAAFNERVRRRFAKLGVQPGSRSPSMPVPTSATFNSRAHRYLRRVGLEVTAAEMRVGQMNTPEIVP